MALTTHSISRQSAHEQIRLLSHEAAHAVKVLGQDNDLVARIRRTPFFEPIWGELEDLLHPRDFVGRAGVQVERFCGVGGEVERVLEGYGGKMGEEGEKGVGLSV